MFGRSTTSRFVKDKKDSVPGPGEYDARAIGTTKRGAGMGSGARMSLMPAAEGAHLGPGAYGVPGETMLGPHSARGGALRRSDATGGARSSLSAISEENNERIKFHGTSARTPWSARSTG